jgi:hypothetical protein
MPTDDPPQYRIRITTDLPNLMNTLQAQLQHLVTLVTLAHRSTESLQNWDASLPNVGINIQLSSWPEASDPRTAKGSFLAWVNRSALRDSIEFFAEYLERVREIACFWHLTGLRPDGAMLGEEWNQRYVREARRFHALGLPARLEFLASTYGVGLIHDKLRYVSGINRMRNCFVHRNGIVSPRDIPIQSSTFAAALQRRRDRYPSEKWTHAQTMAALSDAGLETHFRVQWIRFTVYVEKADGQRRYWTGNELEVRKGDQIGAQVVEREKAVELQHRIVLSAEEFSELALTLVAAAQDLRDNLRLRGQRLGVVPTASVVDF